MKCLKSTLLYTYNITIYSNVRANLYILGYNESTTLRLKCDEVKGFATIYQNAQFHFYVYLLFVIEFVLLFFFCFFFYFWQFDSFISYPLHVIAF